MALVGIMHKPRLVVTAASELLHYKYRPAKTLHCIAPNSNQSDRLRPATSVAFKKRLAKQHRAAGLRAFQSNCPSACHRPTMFPPLWQVPFGRFA